MRLNRLDLTRYGAFTDTSLSFGPTPTPDTPDLHVIYGANEAGKSTLLSGWLDLLFQIPTQSNMAFLHPYKTMRLGAQLEIDGATHDLARIKKRDQSLLNAQDTPIPEALISNGLRGLDRSAYAAMFSLNRHTLDEGGESILASEGDLGELLFQASAGLSDLTAQLDAIRDETDGFLNTTGRKGQLRDLRAEFDALEKQIKEQDTVAADYARLAATRDTARDDWQTARKRAASSQADLSDLDRLDSAVPLADRLIRLNAQIAEFGALPHPPDGWTQDLPALDRAETELSTRADTAQQAVRQVQQEIEKLPSVDLALAAAPAIDAAEALKAAHDTAQHDLPRRLHERDAETAAIHDRLTRLGQQGANTDDILLPPVTIARLRDLIQRHSGIDTALVTAKSELTRARTEAEQAAATLRAAGGTQQDLGGLEALVQRIRREDPQGGHDRAAQHLGDLRAQVSDSVATLAPWVGTAQDLSVLPVPDRAALQQLALDTEQAQNTANRDAETADRLRQEEDQARLKLDGLSPAGAITLVEAAAARTARESAWQDHRGTLSPQTADQFEQAMRLDDQIFAAVSDQRALAAQAAEAQRVLAEKRHAREAATHQAQTSATRRDDLMAQAVQMIASVSPLLPPETGADGLLTWLDRFDRARDSIRQFDQATRADAQAKSHIHRARTDLISALALTGHDLPDGTGLAVALETAQSLLDRAAELTALRHAATATRQAVQHRDDALSAAQATHDGWHSDWTGACSETWLARADRDVPAMRAILDELDMLRGHCDRLAELGHRIAAMQDNRDRFAQAVQALAGQFALPQTTHPQDQWRAITHKLQSARNIRDRQQDLARRLELARNDTRDVEAQSRLHRSRTDEMARLFQVTTWADTRDALGRTGARADLIRARDTLADDLCERMRVPDAEQALARVQDADRTKLSAQMDELKTDLETLRSDQEEAHTAYQQAERAVEAIGGDGAVARLEEHRQTLLLQIEDGARRHLRGRLGILAVEQALHRYRDTHRSGMLKRASEAFRQMSGGRYSGLTAQPDGQRDVLVAVAADGGSKEATQLSEGTRAQLYLALRIAGYHEFTQNSGQVPFVADDIMESFDDARAEQAFALLGQMSRSGQVIYLTHHAHLCDIARAACPQVLIHRL